MGKKIVVLLLCISAVDCLGMKRIQTLPEESGYSTESESDIESSPKSHKKQRKPLITSVINSSKSMALLTHSGQSYILSSINEPDYLKLIKDIDLSRGSLTLGVLSRVYTISYDEKKNAIELKIFTGQKSNPYTLLKAIPLPASGQVRVHISEEFGAEAISLTPVGN